jgi:hypothetical protein
MAQSCQYEGCNVPAEAGSDFCIFHSPSPKDLEKFKSALSNQLNMLGPIEDRNERYIFTGYIFPAAIEASGSPTHAIQLPQTIGRNASFENAQIEGDARFDDALIQGDTRFDNVQIGGNAWFGGCECRSLALGSNKPYIRGWGDARCGILISNPRAGVSFWRFAQRTFSRIGEREKADAAFYFERLNRWRVIRQNKADADTARIKQLWKNWIIRPGYWALFLLDLLFVRWTTAYGASVARLFFTWFLVIGGFGITFSMVPRLIERAGVQVWSLRNWIVGIHYSVTTFATLGLGHIGPGSSRLGMVLTSIEATLGAVLIALAVLVIGRRFMRQG